MPVIGFPLFGDQWDNIARLEFRGMAKTIDSKSFTAESLAADIMEVSKPQTVESFQTQKK